MPDIMFSPNTQSDVTIRAKVAAPGVVAANFRLVNTNDPANRIFISPDPQQDATAQWVIPAGHLQPLNGGVDHMQLLAKNASVFADTVDLYISAIQGGKALPAYDENGNALPSDANGWVRADSLASGANTVVPVGLDLT